MHGGTQTIRFWGLQHVHWCEGSCCWFLRLQSRLVWEVAIQAVDWFVPEHHHVLVLLKAHVAGSCGRKAGWFAVHRRHLMHGGTQTIRFWGLQHVHWCEGSCCWFLRLQSRLVWEVAIQAVDWFVPEHHLSMYWFKVSFLRGSPSAFDAWWHANNPLLGATTCPLVWRLMLLVLAAAKQVGLRGGYPGRWLVCSRASSIYIGLRCRFCEVHRRHLMHGGTQTIRFWGLQHVHWCEGSCCWFLRLQSRLVWEVAIQAVDWFVPEHHHLCIGLRCRFCEVHRRHLMHGGTQTIRFWGLQHVHWCEGSCCWFLRQPGRLVWEVAIQAVDWFVPEHHLSILV